MKRASSPSLSKLESGVDGEVVSTKRTATRSKKASSKKASPLSEACAAGNYDLAKKMIDAGAKVTEDAYLLFQAIESSVDADTKCKLVDLLLSNGAEINVKRDDYPRTPLEAAVDAGCIEAVRLLIRRLFWIACWEGKAALIEALLEADVEETRSLEWASSGLKAVVLSDEIDDVAKERTIKLLVARGIDVNHDLGDGNSRCTALHVACGYDPEEKMISLVPNPALVRVLCRSGADVEAAREDGSTAMHTLCDDNDVIAYAGSLFYDNVWKCIRILLRHGAKANVACHWGCTPLHKVCGLIRTDDPQLARLLCENGADVNAVDGLGRTALHNSCSSYFSDYHYFKFVEILLEHGADVDVADTNGSTPLQLAAWSGKERVVDLLLAHKMKQIATYD